MITRIFSLPAACLALLMLAGAAPAADINDVDVTAMPNTFSAGTPARADQVNQNFEYLRSAMETLKTLLPPNVDTPADCTAAGIIRYAAAEKALQVCDGTNWMSLVARGTQTGAPPVVGQLTLDNGSGPWVMDVVALDFTAERPCGTGGGPTGISCGRPVFTINVGVNLHADGTLFNEMISWFDQGRTLNEARLRLPNGVSIVMDRPLGVDGYQYSVGRPGNLLMTLDLQPGDKVHLTFPDNGPPLFDYWYDAALDGASPCSSPISNRLIVNDSVVNQPLADPGRSDLVPRPVGAAMLGNDDIGGVSTSLYRVVELENVGFDSDAPALFCLAVGAANGEPKVEIEITDGAGGVINRVELLNNVVSRHLLSVDAAGMRQSVSFITEIPSAPK